MARSRKPKNSGLLSLAILGLIAVAIIISFIFTADELLQPKLRPSVTLEAGNPLPDPQVFLSSGSDTAISYVNALTDSQLVTPGKHTVTLNVGGRQRTAVIEVVDRTPPSATVKNLIAFQANMPQAGDFLADIQDATATTATFETAPDPENTAPQTLTILLKDAAGNTTRLTATLTVVIDNEAPELSGVHDIFAYVGDTVAYRKGVTVTDKLDAAASFTVDTTGVDLSTPGTYSATYTATDASGNRTQRTVTVTVYERSESYVPVETVYEAVDTLMKQFITKDMTTREQVKAIYSYIRRNYRYINHSEKDNWVQAAYRMIQDGGSDCFGYYALCKLMLERLDIPNLDVEKVPNYDGDSHHYWSLVSLDGGKTYYHVDTTPRKGLNESLCLITDATLDNISARFGKCFNRDKTLYPATPEA